MYTNTRTGKTEFCTREDGNKRIIEGYFVVFNREIRLYGEIYEQISAQAFAGYRGETTDEDIRALTNHDTTLVLGRTKAGTLALKADEKGLWGSIEINQNDSDAMNLYERVKRGDVDQCSFGFDITDQEVEIREDGSEHWTVKGVVLYEVSVCTFPAYEDTGVKARSKDLAMNIEKNMTEWREQQKERLKKYGA